jgi:hypothetical protein
MRAARIITSALACSLAGQPLVALSRRDEMAAAGGYCGQAAMAKNDDKTMIAIQ